MNRKVAWEVKVGLTWAFRQLSFNKTLRISEILELRHCSPFHIVVAGLGLPFLIFYNDIQCPFFLWTIIKTGSYFFFNPINQTPNYFLQQTIALEDESISRLTTRLLLEHIRHLTHWEFFNPAFDPVRLDQL